MKYLFIVICFLYSIEYCVCSNILKDSGGTTKIATSYKFKDVRDDGNHIQIIMETPVIAKNDYLFIYLDTIGRVVDSSYISLPHPLPANYVSYESHQIGVGNYTKDGWTIEGINTPYINKFDLNWNLVWFKYQQDAYTVPSVQLFKIPNNQTIHFTDESNAFGIEFYDAGSELISKRLIKSPFPIHSQSVCMTSDTSFILTAKGTNRDVSNTFYNFKVNEKGDELWRKEYVSGSNYASIGFYYSLCLKDDTFMLVGNCQNSNSGSTSIIVKFDREGNYVWHKEIPYIFPTQQNQVSNPSIESQHVFKNKILEVEDKSILVWDEKRKIITKINSSGEIIFQKSMDYNNLRFVNHSNGYIHFCYNESDDIFVIKSIVDFFEP